MAGITGQATTYNLPNFVGELFSLTPTETPFLSAIGGLTGGLKTNATKFAIETYDLPAPTQPNNLEGQNAPTASARVRNQVYNVVQIFHETIEVSYTKQAAVGNISGVSILGNQPVQDELTFQTQRALEKIARDVEYTFLQGVFNDPTDNTTARKTRGILTAITTNVINAASAAISKALFEQLLWTMYQNGAPFSDKTVIMLNGNQLNKLADIYGYAPMDRNIGGIQLKQIFTNYGALPIMLNRYMPTDTIAVVDLKVCAPVILEIPDKGFLFREELARTGASTKYQIYGEIGLQHGPESYHGKIIGLAA